MVELQLGACVSLQSNCVAQLSSLVRLRSLKITRVRNLNDEVNIICCVVYHKFPVKKDYTLHSTLWCLLFVVHLKKRLFDSLALLRDSSDEVNASALSVGVFFSRMRKCLPT